MALECRGVDIESEGEEKKTSEDWEWEGLKKVQKVSGRLMPNYVASKSLRIVINRGIKIGSEFHKCEVRKIKLLV